MCLRSFKFCTRLADTPMMMTTNRSSRVAMKGKWVLIASAVLLFAYVGLSLSTSHADAWSQSRESIANIPGVALIILAIGGGVIYLPRYLRSQAQQAAREVLEQTPEERVRQERRDARSLKLKAIGLGAFLVVAVIYECFFTPDAQYARVRSKLEWLEGHQEQEIARLVEQHHDMESARFLVGTRLKHLKADADRLWPETRAAREAPRLPPDVLGSDAAKQKRPTLTSPVGHTISGASCRS